jgi:hypothetical protein
MARTSFGRLATLAVLVVAVPVAVDAQRGRGAAPVPAPSARQAAPFDLTGYWVSPVTEDWKYRMVTPARGVFDAVPLNAEGRKVGASWDPARDEAAGEQCRAYGAPAIMRVPGRLSISWQDDDTLHVETDAGNQTRVFRFRATEPPADRSWQGHSVARWNITGTSPPTGTLQVVTTNLRPGYLRRNGVPYSDRTTVTEYWDVNELPNGDRWLTITTKVDDPVYLTRPMLTSSDFKKLPSANGWNPTPCSAR